MKPVLDEIVPKFKSVATVSKRTTAIHTTHPFWVIVSKEMSDHLRSWRFIIMVILIALSCIGSLYTGVTNMGQVLANENEFLFLKLFSATDGTLPSYIIFIGFLGPLLGISLGFDAINSEQNRGTLSRIVAQPVHRDHVLNAKFIGALIVISVMLFSLSFLVTGAGLIKIGIQPNAEEVLRVIFFTIMSILYVAFWLNLSILFSVRFRHPSTSALCSVAVWLFLTVFYSLIVNLIAKASAPSEFASPEQLQRYQQFVLNLMRMVPSQLYSDATTTILVPTVRSLGPLSIEQIHGTIPSPLPLGQSLLIVWPQITGLLASTIVCFGLSYLFFMRKEIRSR